MIGKKYRGESQYGEKVEGWLVRHPLGKVFLIVYNGWGEPCWVEMKEETLEEVPDVEDILKEVRDVEEPKDITERIKTFEDAVEWCNKNHKTHLTYEYEVIDKELSPTPDLMAYLKLRVITAALNEGWEPTKKDEGWFPYYDGLRVQAYIYYGIQYIEARKLRFKTEELAIYAVEQFHDIYADFCGGGKGGEG